MPQTSRTGSRGGFSLLEALVAITIAGVVMAAAYSVFSAVIQTSRRVEENSDIQQNVRFLFAALENDLRNARPGAAGGGAAAWEEKRMVFGTVDGRGRSGTVAYELKNGKIQRSWTLASQGKSEAPVVADAATCFADWKLSYDRDSASARSQAGADWPRAVTVEACVPASPGRAARRIAKRVWIETEVAEAEKR